MEKYSGKVKVRACFRSQEKAQPLVDKYESQANFEAMTNVDASSADTLARALEGATYAVLVTPHDPARGLSDDADLTANMINAAAEAGVKHIIYVGSWTVKAPEAIKMIASRFSPSEELLETLGSKGGPKWTILRSGFFFNNLAGLIGSGLKTGMAAFPNLHLPAVDPRDLGKIAAAIVSEGKSDVHHGKKYEISGPEMLTVRDIITRVSKAVGKNIVFQELQVEDMKLPPFLLECFKYISDNGSDAIPLDGITKQLCGEHTALEAWLQSQNIGA
ncbi:hypothetical protein CYMTET_34746 [Cymbomonas tetramitiformis]|uniref:NmrA-like domain-containing protein n=1 Tax=Cymbomonas tetramitiformis TaxID=36881 RepID=A0AAE0FAJ0_9CHLO|nr:hypothetical protein CYMTET_34746 [Cymbomonas tetramitiformis]